MIENMFFLDTEHVGEWGNDPLRNIYNFIEWRNNFKEGDGGGDSPSNSSPKIMYVD